jgi:hypothetical protein
LNSNRTHRRTPTDIAFSGGNLEKMRLLLSCSAAAEIELMQIKPQHPMRPRTNNNEVLQFWFHSN